jgi:hypothetical protein
MQKKTVRQKTRTRTGSPKTKRKTVLQQNSGAGGEPPKTIGELRKLLAELGNPWQPDPRLSDEEMIPVFPTGGDGAKKPPGRMLPEGGVIEFLKKTPPSNPFLREVWKERGLLDESDKPRVRRMRQRRPDGSG